MIIEWVLNTIVLLLNGVFGLFPVVTTLPSIGGFDIDANLVTGIGEARTFFTAFWPFLVVFQGFLFLLGYYAVKMLIRLFLGSRTPQ